MTSRPRRRKQARVWAGPMPGQRSCTWAWVRDRARCGRRWPARPSPGCRRGSRRAARPRPALAGAGAVLHSGRIATFSQSGGMVATTSASAERSSAPTYSPKPPDTGGVSVHPARSQAPRYAVTISCRSCSGRSREVMRLTPRSPASTADSTLLAAAHVCVRRSPSGTGRSVTVGSRK